MKLSDHPNLAYLAVFVGTCGHASSEFFAVLSGLAGPEVSVWRYLLGGLGLIAIALARPSTRDLWTPLKEEGVRLVMLAIGGIAFAYLFFHWALDYATIVQVGTLVSLAPIFIGLTNLWINKQPFTAPKIVTGVAAFAGIALLSTDGYLMQIAGTGQQLVGIGMTVLCAFLGAAYAVLAKPLIGRYGAVRVTTITLSLGGVALWFIVGLGWAVWVNPLNLFDLETGSALSLLVLALFNTTITQIVFFGGLAAAPDITRASYIFFLKPVITAMLALFFLSQPVTWIQMLAIAIILGAVLFDFRKEIHKQRRARRQRRAEALAAESAEP